MKKKTRYIVLFSILIIVVAGAAYYFITDKIPGCYTAGCPPEIHADDCTAQGGEIVNFDPYTDDGDGRELFCGDSSTFMGTATGLRCSCICCKPN